MHNCIANGYNLLCNAYTVLEDRETEAVALYFAKYDHTMHTTG